MSSLLRVAVVLLSALGLAAADSSYVEHNETFVPDAILRVTAANYSQSCYPAKLTVLANGTAPGPELRIREGKTTWIRVYNDMDHENLTMVSKRGRQPRMLESDSHSTGMDFLSI